MKRFAILTALLCISAIAFSQNAEEENIKKTLQTESEGFKNHNIDAIKSTWQNDGNASYTYLSKYGYNKTDGWDSLRARIAQSFQQSPTADAPTVKEENFDIHTCGNTAFVVYDRVITPAHDQSAVFPYTGVRHLRDYREMVKDNDGQWKTVSYMVTDPESFTANTDHTIEGDINRMGYELLGANKITEAIEEFKMNVKLFPKSFNVYDSLGEAFAAAGDKKQAIDNYQKSLDLNPNNENGKQWIAKLKGK